jgi:hypothetical protein
MRRRRVLALLSASLVGVAGCSADGESGDGASTPEGGTVTTGDRTTDRTGAGATTTRSRTATDGADRTTSRASTETPRPTPDGSAEFPPRWDPERVFWSRIGPVDGIALDAEVASSTLPEAGVEFTLANRSDRELSSNFSSWELYRWEGGRWYFLAPLFSHMGVSILDPGESHTWTFAFSSEIPPHEVSGSGASEVRIQPVGGGTYAFAIHGYSTAFPGTLWAARFGLDGPDLSLEPSQRVNGATREGETVEVDAAANAAGPDARLATYVLSRTPEAADPRPMITEQVYRRWPLRDALAFVGPDVEEVRVRAYATSHPAFGVTRTDPAVEFGGGVWSGSIENDEAVD